MKITKSKLKEFKSFSNRFHNSDTIRIKDKNEYNRIMKYLDKTKWPYYDIGGGQGAFHIQFDNTKDTMKIRGILQKKGFKIIDPNTEGKLREMIREAIKEARLKDIVPDIIFTAAQYTSKKLDNLARQSWDSSDALTKQIMQSIPIHKWTSFRKDVDKLLKQHSIREGNPSTNVKKQLIKIFQNDPLYKDVIMATNAKDMRKALDTLKSIRGPNSITLLKKHSKKLMGEVSPPGWEGTVKAMKKHKDIDNPWALSWHMKNKGYKSHKESVNEASKPKAGDYVKTVYGIGQINKVKGTIAYIKLPDDNKGFWPADARDLKPTSKKEKGKTLWTESDLGLTYKKGKTITVTHKTSGKEIVIIDKPNVRKEYEKIGYIVKESVNEAKVKRGSKITYTKQFAFGKEGKETAKVVAIKGDIALLDNGDELRLTQIKLKPKNYKVEKLGEGNKLLKQSKLSSTEYQRAKKLSGFKAKDYKWDSKQDLYIKEGKLTEAREIGGYYLMKQLKDLAHDAKRNGEGKLNKALMYLYSRINQSYRDIDLSSEDVLDLLNDPRGRKHSKDIPTWMIDDLFEGKISEAKKKVDVASLSVGNTYTDSKGYPVKIVDIGGSGNTWKITYQDGHGKKKTVRTSLDKGINLYESYRQGDKFELGKDLDYGDEKIHAGDYELVRPKGPHQYQLKDTHSGKQYMIYKKDFEKYTKKKQFTQIKEATQSNIDDLLKNPKVKEIMKRLGIKGSDSKSVAKIVQHFMRNPSSLKAIGV